MMNPGIYPEKPVKKIYEDIHRKIIMDIEEDGLNLNYILGPTKAPGQTYQVTDFRHTRYYNKNTDSDTQANSLMTNAIVYIDNDYHIPQRDVMDEMNDLPKKLLKRGGKKGRRTKGVKKEKSITDKHAEGHVMTFQDERNIEEQKEPMHTPDSKSKENTYEMMVKNYRDQSDENIDYNDSQDDHVDPVYSKDEEDRRILDSNLEVRDRGHSLDKSSLKRKN
jgi:hypothetical protein